VQVTVGELVVDWLCRLHWLTDGQAGDKRAIATALELLLLDAAEACQAPARRL
jgi:hypothetical protein